MHGITYLYSASAACFITYMYIRMRAYRAHAARRIWTYIYTSIATN